MVIIFQLELFHSIVVFKFERSFATVSVVTVEFEIFISKIKVYRRPIRVFIAAFPPIGWPIVTKLGIMPSKRTFDCLKIPFVNLTRDIFFENIIWLHIPCSHWCKYRQLGLHQCQQEIYLKSSIKKLYFLTFRFIP